MVWFTSPYNALTFEMLLQVGKSLMEAVYFAAGLIQTSVIMSQANSTSFLANLNFSALKTRPAVGKDAAETLESRLLRDGMSDDVRCCGWTILHDCISVFAVTVP